MTSFSVIPSDIQRLISYKLPYEDILQFAKVNRTLYDSIYNNQNFWRQLYHRDYQDILPLAGAQTNWRERYLSIGRLYIDGRQIQGKYKQAVFINRHTVLALDIMDDLYRVFVGTGDKRLILQGVHKIDTEMVGLHNPVRAIIYKLDGSVFLMDQSYALFLLDGIKTDHMYIDNAAHHFLNLDDVAFVYAKDPYHLVSANFNLLTGKISDTVIMEKPKEIIYFNKKYIIYRDNRDTYSLNFVDTGLSYEFQPGVRPIYITAGAGRLDHAITDDNRVLSIKTNGDNIEIKEPALRGKAVVSESILGLDGFVYHIYGMQKRIDQRVIYYDSDPFSELKLYITA